MTKYISRQFLVEAYQVPEVIETATWPRWVANSCCSFSVGAGGAVQYVAINQSTNETRVMPGEWIVNERDVLSRYTDKEFADKYMPAAEPGPQLELFKPDPEPDDGEDGDWFAYDSSKPVSLMSVRDYIFLELLKTRMQVNGLNVGEALAGHHEETDEVLTAMGYD